MLENNFCKQSKVIRRNNSHFLVISKYEIIVYLSLFNLNRKVRTKIFNIVMQYLVTENYFRFRQLIVSLKYF